MPDPNQEDWDRMSDEIAILEEMLEHETDTN
jgi:hypothetical protein